ncbi:MAG: prepilin-type N-terminal cleavage/methylation domain-containing protein [Myxococcales bacterium]|nr:prepilin-type N-terminal cleavage/methylation domain-containing protein [Myxococcales bacterium]
MSLERRSQAQRERASAHTRRRRRGFTLIEMMVVVAIIGALASLASGGWQKYSARARRSEALLALKTIHDLQVAYYGENVQYASSFEDLGFDIGGPGLQPDGTAQGMFYTYVLQTWDLNGTPNANYRVTATGDIDPSDPVLDIVIIENQLTVVN